MDFSGINFETIQIVMDDIEYLESQLSHLKLMFITVQTSWLSLVWCMCINVVGSSKPSLYIYGCCPESALVTGWSPQVCLLMLASNLSSVS